MTYGARAGLEGCGLGYRAPFLKRVAEAVELGRISFGDISIMDYEEARETLVRRLKGEKILLGVGPKVADCVLLFSLGKDEAFPIDVWVARALARAYPRLLGPRVMKKLRSGGRANLTKGEYDAISAAARKKFGAYAGYAQQYIFRKARAEGQD